MLLAMILSAAVAAGTTKAALAEDLVTVAEDGTMTATSIELCKTSKGAKQIRLSAEAAPSTGISRDNFVFLFATMSAEFLEGDCKPIGEPIGEVDGDLKISMNGTGFQISVTAGGQTERHSMTWDELDD
ncbi:MAG: hypothetical protein VX899_01240 [Myxococcota bacterium]|nr:hypothetical protein [Myxococcota bacterium]